MEKKETIVDRLERYRKEHFIDTKTEMAKRIGVSPREYQFVESRTDNIRNPNAKFLDKLEAYTGKSKSYWLFGEENYIEKRTEFKRTEETVRELMEEGYIKDTNFSKEIEEALLLAIKADITHLLIKKQQN